MYFILRLLSLLKAGVGYMLMKLVKLYTYLGRIVREGTDKELEKVEQFKQKQIEKAKMDVVIAAKHVLDLEQRVPVVEQQAFQKALKKQNKILTKIK